MKPHRKKTKPAARERSPFPNGDQVPAVLVRLHADSYALLAFRILVVAMQAATILITWQLWRVREDPPLLPALALPQFDIGPWLLASLVVVLVAPRVGLAAHFCLLIVAMLQDQLRMQPELISLALLMLGTLSHPSAKLIARAHLVTIWFFAAFHKLIWPRYYFHIVPWQLRGLFGEAEPWPAVFDILRGGMALFEMSLAVLAVIPRTRKWCAWQAAVFHVGILQYLMFWLRGADGSWGFNEAVWPWNVALVFAGFALIRNWQTPVRHDWRQSGWLARVIVAVFVVSPLGYYLGAVDPYLAHCLYSFNTPIAAMYRPGNEPELILELDALNVPFPPTPRLFEAYFEKVAEPGDVLLIRDYRAWARGRPGWTVVEGAAERQYIKSAD